MDYLPIHERWEKWPHEQRGNGWANIPIPWVQDVQVSLRRMGRSLAVLEEIRNLLSPGLVVRKNDVSFGSNRQPWKSNQPAFFIGWFTSFTFFLTVFKGLSSKRNHHFFNGGNDLIISGSFLQLLHHAVFTAKMTISGATFSSAVSTR